MWFDATCAIQLRHSSFGFPSLFTSVSASWWRNIQFRWVYHRWGRSLSKLGHATLFRRRDWKVAKKLADDCRFDQISFSSLALKFSYVFIIQKEKKKVENFLLKVILNTILYNYNVQLPIIGFFEKIKMCIYSEKSSEVPIVLLKHACNCS